MTDKQKALDALDEISNEYMWEFCDGDDKGTCKVCQLLSTIRAALENAQEWQPIETAPSDTVVLLYSPDRGIANEEKIECRDFRSTKGGSQHAWATHWMPLPNPPILTSKTEE